MEPDFNAINLDSSGPFSSFMDSAPFVLTYLPWVNLVVIILCIVAVWKIYQKAGRPGWECIVPVYNSYIMLKIIGKPTWWLILLFVPFVNIIFIFLICLEMATVFNKGMGFALGLFFLPPIFYLILAFDKSKYIGFAPLVASVNINPPVVPPLDPPMNPPTATPVQ